MLPWFTRYVTYNLLFFALQLVFISSQGGSFLHTVPLPTIVYLELIGTLAVHLILYTSLSFLQTTLLWGVKPWITPSQMESIHLTIWILSIGAIITLNVYYFPLSVFSKLLSPGIPKIMITAAMMVCSGSLCLLLLNTVWRLLRMYPVSFIASTACVLVGVIYSQWIPSVPAHTSAQSNIIFIGIDSLSPTNVNSQTTPNIESFITNSVQFKEAISPLARTYPAWVSILTGLYPEHHRARYNLIPKNLVQSTNSLAFSLQTLGYYTVFATDDRRFNTMGKELGFSKIIGPKMGVNDVLLGTFNDFPLSNLLINLPIGRWFFPYNHYNRASFFSYYPQTFDKALKKELSTYSQKSPIFFAVHFALPHWPYAWSSSLPSELKDEYSVEEREGLYKDSLRRADQQVGELLHTLREYGYLNNSFVLLLSDHGEALYHHGSRQTNAATYQGEGPSILADYFKRKTSTTLDMSAGHGSDLLSSDQYHCVFAVKIYKNQKIVSPIKTITDRVSLIDVAPTVKAFLGLPQNSNYDGISLLSSLNGHYPSTLPQRAFVMESGEFPNQFLSREKARLLGQQFFEVSSSGELELRKNELKRLDEIKLYALIEGDWIFALYPDDSGYIPVILRLSDHHWDDNLVDNFSRISPAPAMLEKIQRFYNKKWNLIPSA